MTHANSSVRPLGLALAALGAGLLIAVTGAATPALAAGMPEAQQAGGAGGSGGSTPRAVYGRIETMPRNGLIGQWTVGGQVYTTTSRTEFDQEDGDFAPGVCVKLDLRADGMTVREIDSESNGDCDRSGYGDEDYDEDDRDGREDRDDHDADSDPDDDGREFYGQVEKMPARTPGGQWVIGGGVYTVTAQTELEQRHGPLEVGACVEVELARDLATVREMQTRPASDCQPGAGSRTDTGELSGTITSLPAGPSYRGEWQVGAFAVTVDADTRLDERRGPFAAGAYVEVDYVTDADGALLAREIETVGGSRP